MALCYNSSLNHNIDYVILNVEKLKPAWSMVISFTQTFRIRNNYFVSLMFDQFVVVVV